MASRADDEKILEYLLQAEKSEAGISLAFISSEAAKEFRRQIYIMIGKRGGFDNISLVINGSDLWIVNREKRDEKERCAPDQTHSSS